MALQYERARNYLAQYKAGRASGRAFGNDPTAANTNLHLDLRGAEMNQKQKEKWERTRSKGMWRFVLLYGVVLFGGLMIVVNSVLNMMLRTFGNINLFYTVLIYLPSGFVFGLAVWLVGEYMYRRALHSTPRSRL
jgi:uncharacterized membrane-anchored protein